MLDRLVMRTQKPLKDQLELALPTAAAPVWLLFGRWPLVTDGEAVGVVAIAQALEGPDKRHPAYDRIAAAMDYIHQNFGGPLSSEDLSRVSGLSVSQLERDFVQLLGMTPRRYLTKIRFDAAIELLSSGMPISDVAQACGYSDQSAFTRAFRSTLGMSPSEYRKRTTQFRADDRT
jgi:AraC-like DNA-binding protein